MAYQKKFQGKVGSRHMLVSCSALNIPWPSSGVPSGGISSHMASQELGWCSRVRCGALPLMCQGLSATGTL